MSCAVLITSIVLFSGCSTSMESEEMKFDPALKEKIRTTEQNNPDEVIRVLIKTDKDLNGEMRTNLESYGIEIETSAGDIITAAGTSGQLKNAARLPFITKIELSQIRKL
jgi:hypothetical protein